MNVQDSPSVILVTGGCGYLGSCFIRDLAQDSRFEGVTIRILDNMQQEGYSALMNLPRQGVFQFLEGDILDPTAVRRALQGVQSVVHLAAIVKTPFSFDHPAYTQQVNQWGTVRLVERCLDMGVKRFIFASSTSVYGPGGPFDELIDCKPVGPYAQSKWRAEQGILTAKERGLNPTILRFGTLYGSAPGMRFLAVPNQFAYLAGIGRPVTIFGTGEQVRPLIHVQDASSTLRFVLAQERETGRQLFNAVSENVSILDMVGAVRKAKPAIRVHHTEQDVLTHLSFTVTSAKLQALGWAPRFSIDAGIVEVVDQFHNLRPITFDDTLVGGAI